MYEMTYFMTKVYEDGVETEGYEVYEMTYFMTLPNEHSTITKVMK